MRKLYVPFVCLLVPAMQGCSHIPDPGQVPEVEPQAILQHIRCEVRQTLEEDYPADKELRKATIGYGLVLKAEEKATQSLTPSLKWPVLQGSIGLGITAESEKERYTQGTTNVSEDLVDTLKAKCESTDTTHEELYPIVGDLGLRQIIKRYVALHNIAAISPRDGFIQELKFRLKFNGGIKPSYELIKGLNPTTTGIFDFTALRQDTHTLTVTIAPFKKPAGAPEVKVRIVNFDEATSDKTRPTVKRHSHKYRSQSLSPSSTPNRQDNSSAKQDVEETLRNRQNQQRLEEFIQERIR